MDDPLPTLQGVVEAREEIFSRKSIWILVFEMIYTFLMQTLILIFYTITKKSKSLEKKKV